MEFEIFWKKKTGILNKNKLKKIILNYFNILINITKTRLINLHKFFLVIWILY